MLYYNFLFDNHSGEQAPLHICMTTNQWLIMVISEYLCGKTIKY